MKRLLAVLVGIAFVAGSGGFAIAQATGTMEKKPAADSKMEKMEKMPKKGATKTAVGTVKSAAPDSLVVAGKEKGKEMEWTFAVDDKTKVKKGGKETMAKDLAAGDKVTVRYMEHDGKATAMSVNAGGARRAETKAAPEKK